MPLLAIPFGCASAGQGIPEVDGDGAASGSDLLVMRDLAPSSDLRGRDLSGFDQGLGDLSVVADLASARDLADARDQSMGDLASSPDLALVVDLATLPDLAPPPDLRPAPDLALACVPQQLPCDTVCQDCPVGQKCSASQGVPVCKALVNNPAQIDQSCSNDGCVAGAVCVLESDVPFRIPALRLCRKFCRIDADCVNGGRCSYALADANGMASGLKICSLKITNCDPVAMTGCPVGSFCYPVTPDGEMGCHAQGAGAGGLCDSSWNCVPGNACLDVGGIPACRKLCHVGNNAECAGIGFGICLPIQGFGGGKYGRCN